jgi:hypothetical protein
MLGDVRRRITTPNVHLVDCKEYAIIKAGTVTLEMLMEHIAHWQVRYVLVLKKNLIFVRSLNSKVVSYHLKVESCKLLARGR